MQSCTITTRKKYCSDCRIELPPVSLFIKNKKTQPPKKPPEEPRTKHVCVLGKKK